MRHHDNGGTTIDAITINIDERGNVTIVDDADDVIDGDLDDRHIDVLVRLIFERASDTGIGSNLDGELNGNEYWHADDNEIHEDCISREDFYSIANSIREKLDEL